MVNFDNFIEHLVCNFENDDKNVLKPDNTNLIITPTFL